MSAQASSTVNFTTLQQQSMQNALAGQQKLSNVTTPLLNVVPQSGLSNPVVSTGTLASHNDTHGSIQAAVSTATSVNPAISGVEIDPIARQMLRMTSTQETRNQQPQTVRCRIYFKKHWLLIHIFTTILVFFF